MAPRVWNSYLNWVFATLENVELSSCLFMMILVILFVLNTSTFQFDDRLQCTSSQNHDRILNTHKFDVILSSKAINFLEVCHSNCILISFSFGMVLRFVKSEKKRNKYTHGHARFKNF